MGEQVHKHIYDINLAWGQFLDFYSDLNNSRMAQEDNFVERQSIGEEIQEPDETPLTNDDLVDDFNGDEAQDNRNFFNAFDDGFDEILSQNRRASVTGEALMVTKPSESGSQNMLGELQKEITEEEGKSKLIKLEPAVAQEESKQETVPDSQLITEEIKE